jgi:ketosteroid isomerase-like protein
MADLKELRKRFAAAYNSHDLETMMKLYGPHAEVIGRPRGRLRGHAEIRADWASLLESMPAGKVTLARQAAEGSVLFTEWVFSQDGKQVTARGVDVAEFEGDQIETQRWYYFRS